MKPFAGPVGGISLLRRVWHFVRWPLLVLVVLYIALLVWRAPSYMAEQRSKEAVAQIHAQRLTMNDVDGKHLPPPPDPKLADATVEGVDANQNGIRDDVELAIFAKYPTDAKVRAAALQYAMTQQLFINYPIDSTDEWRAIAEIDDRAFQCFVETTKSGGFDDLRSIESLVRNSDQRKQKYKDVGRYASSFGLPPGSVCDL